MPFVHYIPNFTLIGNHPSTENLLFDPGGVSAKEILIPYGAACFASKVGMLLGTHYGTIAENVDQLPAMG